MVTRAEILRGALGVERAILEAMNLIPPIVTGTSVNVNIAAASNISAALDYDWIRLYPSVACRVTFGVGVTADAKGMFMAAGVPETFRFKPGHQIAVIRTAGDGTLEIKGIKSTQSPSIVHDSGNLSFPENQAVGTLATVFSVAGINGVFDWTLTDESGKFGILTDSTGVATVTLELLQAFDYETQSSFPLLLTADNGVDAPVSLSLEITVTDIGIPVNTVAPAITGTTESGETLTCSNGTWTNAVSYTKQWYTDDGEEATPIDGATGNTYDLVVGDEGLSIFCEVTATNAEGEAVAESNTVGPITAP